MLVIVVFVLPFAIFYGVVLSLKYNSPINKLLEIFKGVHSQLNSQLIVETLQELLLPGCIRVDIIWSIAGELVKFLHILCYCATSLVQTAELLLLQSHGACRDMC